ncbi:MAG: NYN domain-containing protein, partial [Acidimicrobiales bacterium]
MTSGVMAAEHVVVDGSNIATEGRSTPSLVQLEEAVAELRKELPDAVVTVVVDATFAHRVDPSELERFEQAALRGEYVYPPAGAIGRGDAFLLRIAERVDGIVLSNDSFQEFHGEHEWLFERGRLLGATPVPGVGWIFVPRSPVRGPRSRVAVRDASRAKVRVVKAIAQATREAVRAPATQTVEPSRAPHARSRASGPSPQAVNDPMTFISFIADHPLGDEIAGVVESFTSHGAVVRFGEVRCYVPLSGLGEPAPRAAREVLHRGEERTFVVTALDPFRRGVELALPGIAVVSGRPSEETVAAEVRMARAPASSRGAGLVEAPVRTSRRRSAVAASAAPGEVLERVRVRRSAGAAVTLDEASGIAPEPPVARAPTPPAAKKGSGTRSRTVEADQSEAVAAGAALPTSAAARERVTTAAKVGTAVRRRATSAPDAALRAAAAKRAPGVRVSGRGENGAKSGRAAPTETVAAQARVAKPGAVARSSTSAGIPVATRAKTAPADPAPA